MLLEINNIKTFFKQMKLNLHLYFPEIRKRIISQEVLD